MQIRPFIILLCLLWPVSPAEFSIPCESTAACHSVLNPYYECREQRCLNPQLQTLSARNIVGMVIVFIISGIAISAGIGGGAIFTSVFILIQKYESADAIPLSQISIFASAVMSVALLINKRHPSDPNRLIINYRLIAKLCPTVCAGSLIGVILNKFLPPLLVFIALCYLLVDLTFKIYSKAQIATQKERSQGENQVSLVEKEVKVIEMRTIPNEASGLGLESNNDLTPSISAQKMHSMRVKRKESDTSASKPAEPVMSMSLKINGEKEAKDMMRKRDAPDTSLTFYHTANMTSFAEPTSFLPEPKGFWFLMHQNYGYLEVCGISMVIIVLGSFLRGGRGMDSFIGIDPCGIISVGILVGCLVLCFYLDEVMLYFGRGEAISDEDRWYKWLGLVVGGVGSTLGLGGGVILNPVLLRQGLMVQESFAISGMIILFNSFISAVQFLVVGAFTMGNTVPVLAVTMVGSLFGTIIINQMIQKYKKSAFLLWILFWLLVVSSVVQPLNGIEKLIRNSSGIFSFGSYC